MIWKTIQSICVLYAFCSIIWNIIIPISWKEKITQKIRKTFKKLKFIDDTSFLAKLIFDDVSLIEGGDLDCKIIFSIDKTPVNVPDDLKNIGERIKAENELRLKNGQSPVYTDLHPYAIHSITSFRDDKKNRGEMSMIQLKIRESSYFYSLISIQAMNEPLKDGSTVREKYYKKVIETPKNPSPDGYDIVHAFGMNTLALTKDNCFVFCKRNSSTVPTGQGCYHLSVGEHLNRDVLDLDKHNEPNAIEIIKKGFLQELGVELNEEEKNTIHFYGIAFAKSVCQYGVLGFTHLNNHSNEIIKPSWNTSKDGQYESDGIVFIDADIASIIDFLNNNPNVSMTKFCFLNVCYALMNEPILGRISLNRIDKELKRLRPNALK